MRCGSNFSSTSPASSRAISAASPTKRLSRSLSSLMTVRSSCRCFSFRVGFVSRLVTEALIEVSGVLKSWVIESSRADFKRSPSLEASVLLSCSTARALSIAMAINVPSASSVWRERTGPEIPRLPMTRTPRRTGMKHNRLFARDDGFQAIRIELRYILARPVDFFFAGQKQCGGARFERLGDVARNRIQQLDHISRTKQLLAECIQFLDFAPAPVSVVCLLLCPRGKMAGHDRRNQKSKECHPVLWIGNREFADRRQEVVVISERGCDGHEHGNRETPDSRNDQDGKEKCECDGGGVDAERLLVHECDGKDDAQSCGKAEGKAWQPRPHGLDSSVVFRGALGRE